MQGNLSFEVVAFLHLLPRRLGCEGSLELGTLGSRSMLDMLSSSSSCSSSASSAKSSSWKNKQCTRLRWGNCRAGFCGNKLNWSSTLKTVDRKQGVWRISSWKKGNVMYLVICIRSWSGDGVTDLSRKVLLLCNVLHHVINLVDVSTKAKTDESRLTNWQKISSFVYSSRTLGKLLPNGFVHILQGLGSVAHVLQDLGVGVWVLQSLPLELNGGKCAIDLGQLLLEAFLPLQGHEGNWYKKDAQSIHHDWAGHCQARHTSFSMPFIFGLWQVIQQALYDITDWTLGALHT